MRRAPASSDCSPIGIPSFAVIEFIDTKEKVDAIMDDLQTRCGCGLIEVQETNIIVPPRK